jgi:hypothetical protein
MRHAACFGADIAGMAEKGKNTLYSNQRENSLQAVGSVIMFRNADLLKNKNGRIPKNIQPCLIFFLFAVADFDST